MGLDLSRSGPSRWEIVGGGSWEKRGRGPDWVLNTGVKCESSRGSQPVAFRVSLRVSVCLCFGNQRSTENLGFQVLFGCLVAFLVLLVFLQSGVAPLGISSR